MKEGSNNTTIQANCGGGPFSAVLGGTIETKMWGRAVFGRFIGYGKHRFFADLPLVFPQVSVLFCFLLLLLLLFVFLFVFLVIFFILFFFF